MLFLLIVMVAITVYNIQSNAAYYQNQLYGVPEINNR
jgi:hypothetical protein